MAATLLGAAKFFFHSLQRVSHPASALDASIQVRNYALRKATRLRKEKLIKKRKKPEAEKEKESFMQRILRKKKEALKITSERQRLDDSRMPEAVDDVWIGNFHKYRVYPFEEAVECHRETHHPTMYNVPKAPVNMTIELDMRAAKKNRYIDDFKCAVGIPNKFFGCEERVILAFCKSLEAQKAALDAGAAIAGGTEIIKDVQSGKLGLEEFNFVVAHTDIYPELVSLRGLLKKKYPSIKSGNLGADMKNIVRRFLNGITFSSKTDMFQKDFGWVDITIGHLEMDIPHLKENFTVIVDEIMNYRPKREGPFITRFIMKSPPESEWLLIDPSPFLEKYEIVKEQETQEIVQGVAE